MSVDRLFEYCLPAANNIIPFNDARCRTVDLVMLCDLVNRPMLTDSRRERCLPDGK